MDWRAACGDGGEDDPRLRSRYKGVRRRRWGKWVSEIRVPGTRERLWLGSYATAEAAAVAHAAAVRVLRGRAANANPGGSLINFPGRASGAAACGFGQQQQLSPRSVQRVASDAGMAADAQLRNRVAVSAPPSPAVIGAGAREQGTAYGSWRSGGGGELLVYGELSVDDMEILML